MVGLGLVVKCRGGGGRSCLWPIGGNKAGVKTEGHWRAAPEMQVCRVRWSFVAGWAVDTPPAMLRAGGPRRPHTAGYVGREGRGGGVAGGQSELRKGLVARSFVVHAAAARVAACHQARKKPAEPHPTKVSQEQGQMARGKCNHTGQVRPTTPKSAPHTRGHRGAQGGDGRGRQGRRRREHHKVIMAHRGGPLNKGT